MKKKKGFCGQEEGGPMNIAVFTSNQPRHNALIKALTEAGHTVRAFVEPKSFRPWPQPKPGCEFGTPPSMLQHYWYSVWISEEEIFPGCGFTSAPTMTFRPGEMNLLPQIVRLKEYFAKTDRFVVFSSPYLKGELCDFLIERNALNLHVGIAPEFRGSAPNFWAEYLGRPDLVGAQVQRLAKGLDSGEILAEVRCVKAGTLIPCDDPMRPPPAEIGPQDPFLRGMEACRLGIEAMVDKVEDSMGTWIPVRANDRSQEIAYRRHEDFSEQVVEAYLKRLDGK
jgi:hypothetical protein